MKSFFIVHNEKLVEDRLPIYHDLIDKYLTNEHLNVRQQHKLFNFEIKYKYTELYNKICNVAINICKNEFIKFENYQPVDSLKTYISNKDNYDSWVHNHGLVYNSLTIVYYFSVPKANGGELVLYKQDQHTEISRYKPKEYDLLIFPSYVYHKPLKIDSNNFRISMNTTIEADYTYKD